MIFIKYVYVEGLQKFMKENSGRKAPLCVNVAFLHTRSNSTFYSSLQTRVSGRGVNITKKFL
jgi:hypothetical protein